MSYFPSAREAARALGVPLLLREEPDPRAFRRHDWLGTLAVSAASAARLYVLASGEMSRVGGAAIGLPGGNLVPPGVIWVTGPWGSLAHLPWAVGLADHLARARGRAGLIEREPDGPLRTLARAGRRTSVRFPLAEALLGGAVDAVNTDLEGVSILLRRGGEAPVEGGTTDAAAGDFPLVLADGLPEALDGPYPGADYVAGVILVASFRDHSRFELDAVVRRLRETGHRLLGLTAIGPDVSEAAEAAALRTEEDAEPTVREAARAKQEAQRARVAAAAAQLKAAPPMGTRPAQAKMPGPAASPGITGESVLPAAVKISLSPLAAAHPASGSAPVLPPSSIPPSPPVRPPAPEPGSKPVPGSLLGPESERRMETPLAAELERPLEAGLETPVAAELERPLEAGLETPVAAELEMPLEAGLETPLAVGLETPLEAELETPLAAELERQLEAWPETTPEATLDAGPGSGLGGPFARRGDRATIPLLSTWNRLTIGRSRQRHRAGGVVTVLLMIASAVAFYGVVLRPRLRPPSWPAMFRGKPALLPVEGVDARGVVVSAVTDSTVPAAESTGTAPAWTRAAAESTGTAPAWTRAAAESTGMAPAWTRAAAESTGTAPAWTGAATESTGNTAGSMGIAADTGRVAADSGWTPGDESDDRRRRPGPGSAPGPKTGPIVGSPAVLVTPPGTGQGTGVPDTVVTSATPPGGGPGERFVIHLTSFKFAEEAEIEVNSLRLRGIEARSIETVIQDRGTWYRIVTGNFATFAEAESVALRLQAEGKIPYAHIAADGGRGQPVPVGTLDRARP